MIAATRPATREPADGTLVLFHGRATDEYDLQPVVDALDPEGRLVGVTPRGPFTMPPGGYHWYGPVVRVGYPNRETFEQSFAALSEFLDESVPDIGRTVLGGFSQGSVMAHALGLGDGRPSPAGILAMSGFIPMVEGFALDLASRPRLPVAIAHGIHDPVISAEFGRAARDQLTEAGLDVRYRESPVGHGVNPRGIDELRGWLARTLPARAAA
ncbi:MAG TPA: phospholipase [Solirubrobacteraceae bacterium]|nr:phospholipase [Solirubrobacteraceae bacterium]